MVILLKDTDDKIGTVEILEMRPHDLLMAWSGRETDCATGYAAKTGLMAR